MTHINWLAVIVAAISAFIVGGIWYSPGLFGKAWMKENNFSMDDIRNNNKKAGSIYGWAFFFSLIMSFNLAMFLQDSPIECTGTCAHKTDIVWGTTAGFLAGIWGFAAIAIHSLFEQKSWRLIFINGFYALVALTVMGLVIGAWR